MMVETAQNLSEKNAAGAICEACGREFLCGANVGNCWCFTVEVPQGNLDDWREKYKNCLCEVCLSRVENRAVQNEK